ncbi:hypothetical protein AMS68_007998 [Peltaster fructicola]|uniref:Uncharacterized protein n=1 Tax=Peltaster fructicola TaxID=286661 RepID=A0A6H0Y6L1_9PEZI|nr:hypothetical protein AMS68_007998 [Peltaster fructicola]
MTADFKCLDAMLNQIDNAKESFPRSPFTTDAGIVAFYKLEEDFSLDMAQLCAKELDYAYSWRAPFDPQLERS